jgi:hypothetical protein
MALSSDPDKRARQLAGLRKGREQLARRTLGLDADAAKVDAKAGKGSSAAKAKPAARRGDREVLRYPDREDAPDAANDDDGRRRGDGRRDDDDDRPGRPGFIDGLLGRL